MIHCPVLLIDDSKWCGQTTTTLQTLQIAGQDSRAIRLGSRAAGISISSLRRDQDLRALDDGYDRVEIGTFASCHIAPGLEFAVQLTQKGSVPRQERNASASPGQSAPQQTEHGRRANVV
jgi:hypothetical protein